MRLVALLTAAALLAAAAPARAAVVVPFDPLMRGDCASAGGDVVAVGHLAGVGQTHPITIAERGAAAGELPGFVE